MKPGRIIILSGPSGSGKTTLYQKLLADPQFKGHLKRSVSVTTRDKRDGERHGRDYFFISVDHFLRMRDSGQLLESQKVYQDYYGTPYRPLRSALKKGKNVLLCIEVKGARVVRRKEPDCLAIFVKPPNLTVLKKRLAKRGTESPAVRKARFERARMELRDACRYDYILVNDRLDICYRALKAVLTRELKHPSS